MNERCETCRYWRQYPDDPRLGQCRRESPRENTQYGRAWPTSDIADWCGEWAAKQQHWLEREP